MKRLSERQKVFAKMEKITGIKTIKKKTLSPKQLKPKYEHTVRDLIIERDRGRCAVSGKYHTCRGRLVADHRPVKRGNNRYFFDPRNLTCVCEGANFLAEVDPAVSTAICDVVKKREGIKVYDHMVATKGVPFKLTETHVLTVISELKQRLKANVE